MEYAVPLAGEVIDRVLNVLQIPDLLYQLA